MPASAYACAREDIYRWVADGREYLYFVGWNACTSFGTECRQRHKTWIDWTQLPYEAARGGMPAKQCCLIGELGYVKLL